MEQAAVWASALVGLILTAAILAMANLAAQPAYCRWCEHCRQRLQEERDRLIAQRHANYHRYGRTSADCTDPNCPGRR